MLPGNNRDEPLTNIIPTQVIDGQATTQYEMFTCEDLGLLKMDILGLKTLTIIDDALKLIKNKIDINRIPLDDPKIYKLLSNGHTIGIFQVESEGMQRILKKLKPDCLRICCYGCSVPTRPIRFWYGR